MIILKTLGLFVVTATAEIVGCYLPYSLAQEGRLAVAADSRSRELGGVCLVVDAASHGPRARLCGLWGRLRRGCNAVALAC